ncbi:hypothetical protein D7V86_01530 [bacterium D16-51]|nr:hypothetical protein D7V96_00960 [bacterium D16-59]RKI62481.1 hypothetical protein D7V86_01530 [bacterium D16-51]
MEHQHEEELEDFKRGTLLPAIPIPGTAGFTYVGLFCSIIKLASPLVFLSLWVNFMIPEADAFFYINRAFFVLNILRFIRISG